MDAGSYDPINDVRFLEVELDMWYLGILNKGWEKFARTVTQEKKQIHIALAVQLSGLGVNEAMIEKVLDELKLDKEKPNLWVADDLMKIARALRRITKPMIIACNKVDLAVAKENVERLRREFPDYIFVACSADSELALREAGKAGLISYLPGSCGFELTDLGKSKLNERQLKALDFIRTNVLQVFGSTGVQQVLDTAVFELLGYIAIFPGGVAKLEDKDGRCMPDCFLLQAGATALDFAYKLHTDLGKNFICAKDVRTKRTVGKEHLLKHRDVVEIVSGR